MQFLTSLFGGSENTVLTAVLALGIVLVLILIGLWILKALFEVSSNLGRGRSRRLSVVDSIAIDARRRLVVVRRDNVEHLILTGGAHDLLVEANIPVERPATITRRTASKATPAAPPAPGHSAADTVPPPTGGRSPLERLRDLGRSGSLRKPTSLRHTGLMRPVSRVESAVIPMNPEYTDHPAADSATSGHTQETNGQARLGERGYFRDVSKAEGT